MTMVLNLYRVLNYAAFTFFSVLLVCLIILTPADAIYQCYKTHRLINIFFITGAYVATFILAALIYATRIYTNRTVLSAIPKAWIPVEKEDVGKSVRRLVVEGLARSAIIAFQARPRDIAADGDKFADYPMLVVDRDQPPWGKVEHPGWSSPSSPDLPDLPYRAVVQELPHLIEAKAVSLAPPDPFLSAAAHHRFDPSLSDHGQSVPDTRVVEVLRRPASMGLREYIQHLTALNLVNPPEIGAEFLAHYERARFSSRELHEDEFRELMHVFADVLRGMTYLDARILDDIRGGSSRGDSESLIGPSDEEGETDTVEFLDDSDALSLRRSNSLQPSVASSTWESRSVHTAPTAQSRGSPVASRHHDRYRTLAPPRTPSTRSLRRMQSNVSGSSSGGSVIRLVDPRGPSDLPYAYNLDTTNSRS
ncbi:DUF4129 domain-containing protein [Aspergillus fischeri NRRL 181]|uniref:Defect at low temperature protein 1 n=1 Tax=Neosartorya fischeri (strain ATCC 1020 / DSM 3700 / CBS 544.65 / FGSC A1164 / JCM 1740 / NRRL 181 / WB 181) TaxID=331117 RepID=A1CWI3_NEOFI|nr:conserved hypothetical protein [Aspergillus fischeri NRRL 181]EAW24985.1 conserved hypothetical protein [Aspergillus fischeri NRRL 181]